MDVLNEELGGGDLWNTKKINCCWEAEWADRTTVEIISSLARWAQQPQPNHFKYLLVKIGEIFRYSAIQADRGYSLPIDRLEWKDRKLNR